MKSRSSAAYKKIAVQPSAEGQSLDCLREASLFSNFTDKEIARFRGAVPSRSYKKHEILYLEHKPAKLFYVIRSGWIKLFRTMPDGQEVIVDMLTANDMFGESAIFEQDRHMCSAQVIEDAQLISIPSKLLNEQIRLNSKLALNMLSFMSRHHRHHCGELAFNTTRSAPQRIGLFLLKLCQRNQKDGTILHLPYDKTLIADTLGMRPATFSRALNILRQKTAIRINGSRVEMDSVERLAKFVYGSLATKYLARQQQSGAQ